MMSLILIRLGGAKRWQATKRKTPILGGGGVDPYRHHDISLHFTKGYSRHKTKVTVKRNFIQPFHSLIKNTKEI